MPMTVRELVSDQRLRLDLLVAGDQDRAIRWVHSSEMPEPGRYLTGSEVVLTAGVWFMAGTSPETWVASLVQARAAAVGFGLTPLLPSVPAALVDACRARGLALFRLPVDMAFVAVAEAFVARYVADHERPLRDAVRRNQQLIATIADGVGIDGVLAILRQHRTGSMFVASRVRGLLAWNGERPSDELVARALAEAGAQGRQNPSRTVEARAVVGAAGSGTYLFLERSAAPEPLDARMAVDQALPYIGLELQRVVALRETERRIAAELFDLVMAGPTMVPATASRLATLHFGADDPLLGFVAVVDASGGALDHIEAILAAEGLRGVAAVKGTEVWGLARWERTLDEARVLATRLLEASGPEGYIGLGRPVTGAEHLHESLSEAQRACRLASQRRRERVATYAEVGTYQLLLALHDEETLDTFKGAVLGPVIEYDKRRGTELLQTLERFLSSGGEYASTAKELNIHVNTLRLRLARVESLTGRRLDRGDDRIDLHLALRIGR